MLISLSLYRSRFLFWAAWPYVCRVVSYFVILRSTWQNTSMSRPCPSWTRCWRQIHTHGGALYRLVKNQLKALLILWDLIGNLILLIGEWGFMMVDLLIGSFWSVIVNPGVLNAAHLSIPAVFRRDSKLRKLLLGPATNPAVHEFDGKSCRTPEHHRTSLSLGIITMVSLLKSLFI